MLAHLLLLNRLVSLICKQLLRVRWGYTFCAVVLGLSPLAAGAQSAPSIVAVTVPTVSESTALLRARFYPNTTGNVQAWFNWGKTTNIANRTPAQVSTGGTNSIVFSNLLTRLATNQTYYFRCTVSNRFGISRSAILTFKTKHDVEFQTLAAINIESDRALLAATFSAQHSGKSWFKWGTASNSVPNTTVLVDYAAGTNSISISNLISGLTPNRTYYYRVMASNQFGISGSAVSNFTTPLNFAVTNSSPYVFSPNGTAFAGGFSNYWLVDIHWFEWGTNTSNVNSTAPWPVYGRETYQNVYDLLPNTTYYWRLVATNAYGKATSPWVTFKTPTGLTVNTYPPGSGNTVPTGPGYPIGIGPIGSTTARLGAAIGNVLPIVTDTWFEWGTSTKYENRTAVAVSAPWSFEVFTNITGLQEAGVIYHYRAVASNSVGVEFGQDQTFATPLFPLVMASTNLPLVRYGRTLSGDFNSDGRLDLVVAGESSTGQISQVWLNK